MGTLCNFSQRVEEKLLDSRLTEILAVTRQLKKTLPPLDYYRTRVRSLGMLVTHSLTNSLTDSCLVNLTDVTLACKNANSKLVEVVTVADVDAEDNVGNSLLQIWELTFWSKS